MKRILIVTEKPFHPMAFKMISNVLEYGFIVDLIESYDSRESLISELNNRSEINALIVRSDKIDSEIIDITLKKGLKLIVRAGSGYDNIDTFYAKEKGVIVMNTPGQNSNAVAELVFSLLFYKARNQFNGVQGFEISGKTIGIVGMGHIGKRIAAIANAFNMHVCMYDPLIKHNEVPINVTPIFSLDELFLCSQIVTLHLPLNKDTLGLVDIKSLSRMEEGSVLINTSREGIVDEEALVKILKTERIHYIADGGNIRYWRR